MLIQLPRCAGKHILSSDQYIRVCFALLTMTHRNVNEVTPSGRELE